MCPELFQRESREQKQVLTELFVVVRKTPQTSSVLRLQDVESSSSLTDEAADKSRMLAFSGPSDEILEDSDHVMSSPAGLPSGSQLCDSFYQCHECCSSCLEDSGTGSKGHCKSCPCVQAWTHKKDVPLHWVMVGGRPALHHDTQSLHR
ncbi:putative glutamate--tRNA ligase, mitochondrial [Manis javanica]|nr:putative glutamate--tRNA ligase, mitochondrial [Manis javanica]